MAHADILSEISNAKVIDEYNRWNKIALEGYDEDPYTGPKTIGILEALASHFYIVHIFLEEGEGIGGFGPQSIHLLHSALARQTYSFGGHSKWSNVYEIAASLLYGMVKNHPFHDANKRTAFLVTLGFLLKNNICPTSQEATKNIEDLLVDVADDNWSNINDRDFASTNPDDRIMLISWCLKRNTRMMISQEKIIRYRDLDQLLKKFGYYLANPNNNFIDVMKQNKSFFRGSDKKITNIVFPGMHSVVQKNVVRDLRKKLGLSIKEGVDQAVFYSSAQPLQFMTAKYYDILKSLAYR